VLDHDREYSRGDIALGVGRRVSTLGVRRQGKFGNPSSSIGQNGLPVRLGGLAPQRVFRRRVCWCANISPPSGI